MGSGRNLAFTGTCLLIGGLAVHGCGPALTIGGLIGLGQLNDDSDDDNLPPAATITTPTGVVTDVVAISYRLNDAEGDRASIRVEFDAGAGFQLATASLAAGSEGTTNLETGATGTDHVFLWSSAKDLGFVNQTSPQVVVRITPTDATTNLSGAAVETTPFSVFNEYITTIAQRLPPVGVAPFGIDLEQDGSIVLADGPGNRVLRVARSDGDTALIAGTGEAGFNGDGILGAGALVNFPTAVAALKDGSGDVLIADGLNNLLRRVDGQTGFITSFAGGGGDFGEAILATDAVIFPRDLTVDAEGTPLFTEEERIRAVHLLGTLPIPFPRGSVDFTLNPEYGSDPYLLDPGEVLTVLGDNLTPLGGQPSLSYEPSTASRVAAWGGPTTGGPRLLFILELGPLNGNIFDDGVSVFPRLIVANQDTVGGTISFQVGAGMVSVDPGDYGELLNGDSVPPSLPVLSDLADLTLLSERLVILSSFRSGNLFALNLDTAPVSVLGTLVPAGDLVRVAGGMSGPGFQGDGVAPLNAQLQPTAVVADPATGAIYMGEGTNRVRVVTDALPVTVGTTTIPANATGALPAIVPGTAAGVVTPLFCRPGPGGDLLVTDLATDDPRSNRVLRVDQRTAQVTAVMGNGVFGDSGDGGPAAAASIGGPFMASMNGSGTLLVVSDSEHHRVRAVNLTSAPQTFLGVTIQPGEVETVVGTGTASPDPMTVGDGLSPTAATLNQPSTVFFDAQGLLWVGDTVNERVRVCNPRTTPVTVAGVTIAPGTIQTVVGDGTSGTAAADGDGGPGSAAQLNKAGPIPGDDGLIYLLDGNSEMMREVRIRVLNTSSAPVTRAGVTIQPTHIDTVIGSGAIRLPDGSNQGDGGPAGAATFRELSGLAVRADGLALVCDPADHVIRVANLSSAAIALGGVNLAAGTIDTLIGNGLPGFAGETIFTSAPYFSSPGAGPLSGPYGVTILPGGRVLFAEAGNGAVRLANLSAGRQSFGGVSADPGEVVVVAGSRTGKVRAEVPEAVAVDPSSGLVVFSDNGLFGDKSFLKAVDPNTRVVTLVAGGGQGNSAFSPTVGDGGPATLARLGFVRGLHADTDGSIYLADVGRNRVRFVNRSSSPRSPITGQAAILPGHIDTVVNGDGDGNIGPGFDHGVDVLAGDLDLAIVTQVSVSGNILWLSDEGYTQIVRVDMTTGLVDGIRPATVATGLAAIDGTSVYFARRQFGNGATRIQRVDYLGGNAFSAATNVAGTLFPQWNGDLLTATSMNLSNVEGIAFDPAAQVIYVADTGNHRVVGVNVGVSSVTIAGQTIGAGQARTLAGAGRGTPGFNGDAVPPEVALLSSPTSVAISPDGGLLIVDQGNGRLRRFQR